MRITTIAAVLGMAYLAFRTYSGWMGQQLSIASAQVQQQLMSARLTASRADAEALMRVGRLDEAEAVLQQIAELDPAFAALPELRAQMAAERELASIYERAMQQIKAAEWLGAKASLERLIAIEPNYRDADIQIIYIDRQTLLGNLLSDGEAAFERADWEKAVAAFETVRTLHPGHQPDYVTERLFQSYVSAGRAVLIGQEDSLAALAQAEGHLRKALALRPQDADIKREREMAGLYLKAQNDFDVGNWGDVISALELVIMPKELLGRRFTTPTWREANTRCRYRTTRTL